MSNFINSSAISKSKMATSTWSLFSSAFVKLSVVRKIWTSLGQLDLNPYCSSTNISFILRCFIIWLTRTCSSYRVLQTSNMRDTPDSNYLDWICFITFLYIKVTFDCFQEAGTMPFLNDCWDRWVNKRAISKAGCFRKVVCYKKSACILSGSADLFKSDFKKRFLTP